MNTIPKLLIPCVLAIGTAGLTHASDADGQRDVSIYDQDPSCSERGELKPGQVPKCVELAPGGPGGRVLPQNQRGLANGAAFPNSGAVQNGGTFNSSVNGRPQNGGTFSSSVDGRAQNGGSFNNSISGNAQNGGTFSSSANGQAQNGGTFTGSAGTGSTAQAPAQMRGR